MYHKTSFSDPWTNCPTLSSAKHSDTLPSLLSHEQSSLTKTWKKNMKYESQESRSWLTYIRTQRVVV